MTEKKAEEGLSPEMEAFWGSRERPRRGPKPAMSVEGIVAAAIIIADAEGLDAVSMGRIAKELGHTPMSLYRYVDSKGVLLALMLDTIVGLPPEVIPGEAWRAALERWSWAQLRGFRKHPWTLQVPVSGLGFSPNRLAWLECGLQMLADTALTGQDKASSLLVLSSYILSEVRLARDMQLEHEQFASATGQAASFGKIITQLVESGRYPEVSKVLATGIFDDDGDDEMESETEFGLQRILDGIEVLLVKRHEQQHAPATQSAG